MKVIWIVLIALVVVVMAVCLVMRCLEMADKRDSVLSVYEQMLKSNPTGAGKR